VFVRELFVCACVFRAWEGVGWIQIVGWRSMYVLRTSMLRSSCSLPPPIAASGNRLTATICPV
jgi:hypothetical protein